MRTITLHSLLIAFAARNAHAFVHTAARKRMAAFGASHTMTTHTMTTRSTSMCMHQSGSSYDVDSDEDAEQRLNGADLVLTVDPSDFDDIDGDVVAPNGVAATEPGRFDALISAVGLEGKLRHLGALDDKRSVSNYDVFCNRELNMSEIRAIGFDMDYTLAQYQQPAFDKLAFDGAKEKLVHKMGYPEEVLNFEYDHTRWARGLIIDIQRGNFLKIDRHKYVRVAYHGVEKISSRTRKLIYSKTFNKVMSFTEKSFINMDTLFQFVDAHLFALLIQLKDDGEHEFLDLKTYEEMYRQIRECVDLCHRDGVIKDEVAKNPEKYIVLDRGLVPMLKRYREAGVKLFLLTNSHWEYTSTAMNYLYHEKKVEGELYTKNEWTELFDIVICGSCKPAFMLDPYLQLFRVDMANGSLRNTDGIYEIDALGPDGVKKFLKMGKVFQGGNWRHLQRMLEVDVGEEIMYVGDHLYADVLRSKRTLGWRSMFIMPELDDEIRTFSHGIPLMRKIRRLRKLRSELGLYGERVRQHGDLQDLNVQTILAELDEDDAAIKSRLSSMLEQWHGAFHPIWGAIFNAGYQDSRFGFYVENYACLYSSRATNLGLSSTERSFRTTTEMLPHDKLLADPMSEFTDTNPWSVEEVA